jgi:hypothetical protein
MYTDQGIFLATCAEGVCIRSTKKRRLFKGGPSWKTGALEGAEQLLTQAAAFTLFTDNFFRPVLLLPQTSTAAGLRAS